MRQLFISNINLSSQLLMPSMNLSSTKPLFISKLNLSSTMQLFTSKMNELYEHDRSKLCDAIAHVNHHSKLHEATAQLYYV